MYDIIGMNVAIVIHIIIIIIIIGNVHSRNTIMYITNEAVYAYKIAAEIINY